MQRSGRSKMVFLKNKSGFAPAGRLAVRNLVIFFCNTAILWCDVQTLGFAAYTIVGKIAFSMVLSRFLLECTFIFVCKTPFQY